MRPDEALASRLAAWPEPIFVVIDGARFADVAAVCARADLPARSLFLEQRDPAIVAAGPFLAPLSKAKLGRLLAIAGIENACTFWGGDVSEPVLFRSLRSVNLAEIPSLVGSNPQQARSATEIVLFRHWDPAVLAVVLPVLESAQRARLFGPMARLCIYDNVLGAAFQAVRRPDWPPPVRGFLRLSSEQITKVADAMAGRSRQKIAGYLRDTAPDRTADMGDEELLGFLLSTETVARSWGLKEEAGFGRFAWLMISTGGKLQSMTVAEDYVRYGGDTPDRNLHNLMSAMVVGLRAQGTSS